MNQKGLQVPTDSKSWGSRISEQSIPSEIAQGWRSQLYPQAILRFSELFLPPSTATSLEPIPLPIPGSREESSARVRARWSQGDCLSCSDC